VVLMKNMRCLRPIKTFLPIFKVVFIKNIFIFGKIVMLFEGIIGIVGEF
jgi:hypothetical protein